MNYIDIILLVPLAWGAINGFRKGLIIEIASLLALVAGVYGAIEFSFLVSKSLSQYVDWSPRLMQMASFCITFIGIVLLVHLVARGVQKLAKLAALGMLNRILGIVFGTLKYLILVSIFVYVIHSIDQRYAFMDKNEKAESLLFEPLSKIIPVIYPTVEAYMNED